MTTIELVERFLAGVAIGSFLGLFIIYILARKGLL